MTSTIVGAAVGWYFRRRYVRPGIRCEVWGWRHTAKREAESFRRRWER